MASIRRRPRTDGTYTYAVLFTVDARQTSVPFTDESEAEKFRVLVNAVGGKRAMEASGIGETHKSVKAGPTLAEYLARHIAGLSGVERKTITEYQRYLQNDIAPVLGAIPLAKLTREDVAGWVNAMHEAGAAGGTIQNKSGFLSGALNRAVETNQLSANPCLGVRLPRTEEREMCFLEPDEYQILKSYFSDRYKPLVEFLVSSGCRASEALALRPSDVDRAAGTVRITRAWKKDGPRYYLGPPKTKKSVRTINVPKAVLDQLDYSHEWLFVGSNGGPIRLYSWRSNVWVKTRAKAMACDENNPAKPVLEKSPRIHDLRHTCASWMINAGVPLPVIQAHLGHESIATTVDHYGHLDRKSAAAAADAIAAALSA
ncbi:site-specific integrase [Mycolicibacterium komossense]|uniref:Site-specific integrase n=2 Tax=Mycolicibacterium komossense TaxID=1779 RepID=A0ABT3CI14_9MYCO|nr:site-specific integrase [Mycolicibacterium komossense]